MGFGLRKVIWMGELQGGIAIGVNCGDGHRNWDCTVRLEKQLGSWGKAGNSYRIEKIKKKIWD